MTIHPDKSNLVLFNGHKSISKMKYSLDLNGRAVQLYTISIEERLKLGRRALYALINTSGYCSNGLNPPVLYKINQCYVVPRKRYK